MPKRLLTFLFIFILSSCSMGFEEKEANFCPRAQIQRSDAYFIVKDQKHENFVVELTGYEGYCYFDKRVNHDKAVITPIFKVKRLRPSDESDVLFSYYTETVDGPPEYLGKKTYFAKVHIPLNTIETEYRANQVEVRIPPEMKYSFDIHLGLGVSEGDKEYNQRTFDVPLNYEEK